MIGPQATAVVGIAALLGTLILILIGVVVASRRWSQERRDLRRKLNQALAGIDVERGYDLEQTRLIVRGHRRKG